MPKPPWPAASEVLRHDPPHPCRFTFTQNASITASIIVKHTWHLGPLHDMTLCLRTMKTSCKAKETFKINFNNLNAYLKKISRL